MRSLIAGLALFLFLPLVANAYTLVLRDGRRVEIPNNFEVGASTLTYEAAPGIQITVQLATLDVAATERSNSEKSGSLLARLTKTRVEPVSKVTATVTPTRRPIVTNEDLERYRKAREASEIAYEQRRKELGLPSVEETRRPAMEITERTHEQLVSIRAKEQESEEYWRQRASELRSELAATNARINFVQARMNELPLNYGFGAFTTISPFLSVDQLSRGASFPAFVNGGTFGPRFGAWAFGINRRPGQINRFNRPEFARRPFGNAFPFGTLVAYLSTLTTTRMNGLGCCRNLINCSRSAPDCKRVGVILRTKPEGVAHIPVG
jgi:hypothetical protein